MLSKEEIDVLSKGYELKGNDECFYLIHGFTGSASELYPLASLFHEAGYSVKAISLPGHGTSSLKALRKANPKKWMEAVLKGYLEARKKYRKVYVLGYSMGGSLALTIAYHEMPDAYILVEPALVPNSNLRWLAKLLKWAPFKISWGGSLPHYEDGSELYWRGQNGYYIKSAADLLKVAKMAKRIVPEVSCPIYATWASLDKSIRKEGVDFIIDNAKSSTKVLRVYPHNDHHLPSEKEKSVLALEAISFVKDNCH